MGQLERYGLYVLCVVIFLILGVALWGGDPAVPSLAPSTALEAARNQTQSPAKAVVPERDEDVVERLRRQFSTSSVREPAAAPLDATLALDGVRDAGVQPVSADLVGVKPAPIVTLTANTVREYEVKKDDVLETIAKAQLGGAKHWRDILTANPGLVATKLRPGMKIKLPAIDKAVTAPAGALGKDVYVVKKNDVFESIAREQLGSSLRWKEIAAANPGVDPRRLQPGMQLRLPAPDSGARKR